VVDIGSPEAYHAVNERFARREKRKSGISGQEMASVSAGWASCYQEGRKIGAVIVKDKRILTTAITARPMG
jgi:deoxycytidylate deaminase